MTDRLYETGNLFFGYPEYPIFNLPFWTKQSLLDELQNAFGFVDSLRVPTTLSGALRLTRRSLARNVLEQLVYDLCFEQTRISVHLVQVEHARKSQCLLNRSHLLGS